MNNKKTILFVNGHLQVGGVEKALVDLLTCIDYNKFEVDLLLLEGLGDYLSEIPSNVSIYQRDIRQIEGPFVSVLWRNIVRGRIDCVIYRVVLLLSKYLGESLLCTLRWLLPVRRRYDTAIAFRTGHSSQLVGYTINAAHKYLWWHHGSVHESNEQIDYITKLGTKFDSIVTVSSGCKNLLELAFHDRLGSIKVIPNVINIPKITQLAQQYNPPIPSGVMKFITVSRFSSEKHIEDAVAAAALLYKKLDFVWFIIGDGYEFNRLKELVKLKGLEEVVILTGRIANPYPYLKHADLMIHPSHVESLCIAVLEAMAFEVPCVVVRSIGPESFIANGRNGILVEKGPESIANGILQVVNAKHSLIDTLKKNGVNTVEKYFSPAVVRKAFEELIEV